MATPVELPKLGNTVEECIIASWRKRKGDKVVTGDVLADIETDKATFDISAPVDGTVLETFFEEGAVVPVFTNICVIGKPGESVDSFRPGGTAASPAASVANAPAAAAPNSKSVASTEESVAPQTKVAASAPLSPRASRFAQEHNFHPAAITGSGPGGRILEADLRKAHATAATPASSPPKTNDSAGARVSGIRDKIARRMRDSLASTAQYTMNASADATGLLRLRAKIKSANGAANINDLVTFCVVKALLEVPELNAEFIDGRIVKHAEVRIGFACDTPRGLMVPVIRDAQKLTVEELARQSKDLGSRAVQGTISADDLSGATFTISNLGNLGIESFTPLLNPPQVAILGVGAIQLQPKRVNGAVEFADTIGLSLTCDHQVIDGAPGARFLQVLKQKIETVEALCGS